MAETRDRGSVLATEKGIQILKDAKAAKRNHNAKPWTYQDIQIESGVNEKTIGRFFRREKSIDESGARAICQALSVEFNDVVEIHSSADTPDDQEDEAKWRTTCRELLNHWKGLTTNALTKPNGIRFQLDEIFVPLGVVERRQKPKHCSNDGFPAEQGSELYEEKVTPISQNDFFEQVLRQRQSKHSQGSRIAIIGEPGAGKTTQLQKIGDWILEETDGMPIWIPLTAVGTRKLKDYLLSDWLQTAIQELEVSQDHRDDLVKLLKTGKVWLLLDGVDEMAISDALHQIATQIREGWLQNVRVVLTCRLNVWDVGKNALDGFDVYRNLDFEYPSEVNQFIGKWFATEPALQQKLKAALEQPGKERIRDMVKNPLRLTLLCYSWQLRQGELPETKAGLYEWFVDAFYEWNKGKVPTKLSVAKREELNRALGDLGKEAIGQETSRFRLREKFINQFLGDADDEDSLFYLALQLGWLNRVGVAAENSLEDVYAFFHTTFQEYFAALAIDDWHFFLTHISHDLENSIYRIFEPKWQEVMLAWASRLRNVEQGSDFFEEILYFMVDVSEHGLKFYGEISFFLLAEISNNINKNFTQEYVIPELLKTGFLNFKEDNYLIIDDPAALAARETILKLDSKVASSALLTILNEHNNENYHLLAARMLQKIAGSYSIANAKLEEIMEHGSNNYIRLKAASFLIKACERNKELVNKLIDLATSFLKNSDEIEIRTDSFRILKKIKLFFPKTEARIDNLLDKPLSYNFWKDEISPLNLELIDSESTLVKAKKKLKLLLEEEEEEEKRLMSAFVLVYYESDKSLVISTLISIFTNAKRKISQYLSAIILCRFIDYQPSLVVDSEIIVGLTIEFLTNNESMQLFHYASDSLEFIYQHDLLLLIVSSLSQYYKNHSVIENETDLTRLWYINIVLWHCAKNMSYPDFYRAWNDSSFKPRRARNP